MPFMLLFLASCLNISVFFANCDTPLVEQNNDDDTSLQYHPHQVQIDRLEQLVSNLSKLIAKLEGQTGLLSKIGDPGTTQNDFERAKVDRSDYRDTKLVKQVENDGFQGKVGDGKNLKMASVKKYSPFWSERFQFASAVNLDSAATCLNILPFRDYEGLSKYIAVGDNGGKVYVFMRIGDLLVEFQTSTHSPITAMLSFTSFYKNETFLVTGHSNGVVLMHRLWEGPVGEDWSSIHMEHVTALDFVKAGEVGSPITILEVHHVGRSRYILSADAVGKIRVFIGNGELYGLAVPTSRPLVFLKQRLLFLTETGAGSLDLRTMKLREAECEGLNHSLARNYVFDATERSKAYGFTSAGELIHVVLLGDIMNFKCRVRSRRKVEMNEPLAFQAIKGYLMIVSQDKVHVYNVSSHHYARSGAPRPVFSTGIGEIRSLFSGYRETDEEGQGRQELIPLIASDREKLVILGLGGGCVGMYHSNLPVSKGESNTMLWTSPVLFFILFLFGAWQFFAKKKEALTSWGPDDPFTSTSIASGAPPGTGSGERFADLNSRSTDSMDLRANGLRSASRKYPSPSRYTGGGANAYRPSNVDTSNPRPASVDPHFRAASELKFRGSNLDHGAFPKRRENIYGGNQVVDDGN